MPQPKLNESTRNMLTAIEGTLRDVPLARLAHDEVELYAKLEFLGPGGSVKDRPAFWILKKAIERGQVDESTTLVESSSGNFASSLAIYARLMELNFVPVIDPNITGVYEAFLRSTCRTVVKVTERDDTGGYLKTRLAKVQELCAQGNVFWPNQYGNLDGMEAHYRLTAQGLCDGMSQLDYVFLGVSSAGTIAGVSRRLKERFPHVKVIAVDVEGSVIFGGAPRKRFIPGIGASIVPPLVREAIIDDVVMVSEVDTVRACKELLSRHGLFVGGSSGSAYAAIQSYLPRMKGLHRPRVAFLCCDRGTAYVDTIFNPRWEESLLLQGTPPSVPPSLRVA